MPWSPRVILFMQKLTNAGKSADEIIKRVNRTFGTNKKRGTITGLWARGTVDRDFAKISIDPRFTGPRKVKVKKSRGGKQRRKIHKPRERAIVTGGIVVFVPVNREQPPEARPSPSYSGPINGIGVELVHERKDRQCQWPVGGDKYRLMVCGHPKQSDDKRYCTAHVQLALQPSERTTLTADT